jgi:hypothetical protein
MAQPRSTQPLFVTIATYGEASILELDPRHHLRHQRPLVVAHSEAFMASNATAAQILTNYLAHDATCVKAISMFVRDGGERKGHDECKRR